MFEIAELGHEISKSSYERQLPALRKALLDAQYELLKSAKFPVIILIGGVEGAGRGQTVKKLNEWMDARYIETNAMYVATDEEEAHPDMWKFWNTLPAKGKIGIYFGSWYTKPVVNRTFRKIKQGDFDEALDNIINFEKMLTDEGALVLKFWIHLSKETQKKQIKKKMKDKKKKWMINKTEIKYFKNYDKFKETSEHALMRTSTAEAPWTIIEGTDARYRYLTVGKALLEALQSKLNEETVSQTHPLPKTPTSIDNKTLLGSLKYNQKIKKEEYEKKLLMQQERLRFLTNLTKEKNLSLMTVFEGVDAAGKGGSIRRIAGALDPRNYRIIPIAAPNSEEKKYPYLWRFWRCIPRDGNITIFDRSWYGRVLVERIEGFCTEFDWKRAYSEINDFEDQLTSNQNILIKFWLSISKEEQLRRFELREETPFKYYKITQEDWRNREKWDSYQLAAEEMINRTSTEHAPWHIIEANNKHYAHIKVLEKLCDHIEKILKRY